MCDDLWLAKLCEFSMGYPSTLTHTNTHTHKLTGWWCQHTELNQKIFSHSLITVTMGCECDCHNLILFISNSPPDTRMDFHNFLRFSIIIVIRIMIIISNETSSRWTQLWNRQWVLRKECSYRGFCFCSHRSVVDARIRTWPAAQAAKANTWIHSCY